MKFPSLSYGSPTRRILDGLQTCVVWLLCALMTVFATLAGIIYLTLVLLVMMAIVVAVVGLPMLGLFNLAIIIHRVTGV